MGVNVLDAMIGITYILVFVGMVAAVGSLALSSISAASRDAEAISFLDFGLDSISGLVAQLGTLGTVIGAMFIMYFLVALFSDVGNTSNNV